MLKILENPEAITIVDITDPDLPDAERHGKLTWADLAATPAGLFSLYILSFKDVFHSIYCHLRVFFTLKLRPARRTRGVPVRAAPPLPMWGPPRGHAIGAAAGGSKIDRTQGKRTGSALIYGVANLVLHLSVAGGCNPDDAAPGPQAGAGKKQF